MIPQLRKYFAIIVHYGPAPQTERLITDLLNQKSVPDKIILIDHQGNMKSNHSLVQSIKPQKNEGYAAGLSVGLGMLYSQGIEGADIVLCLNNDVRLHPRLVSYLHSYYQNPSHVRTLISALQGRVNLFSGRSHLFSQKKSQLFWSLSYPHGSCFAAPFQMFADIQGVPDSLFLYWEDVLLGVKARRRNYALNLFPVGLIEHDEKKDEKLSDDKVYYLVRNGAWFLQKQPFPWDIYWKGINRLRYFYHQMRGNQVILEALYDARSETLGKRKVI